MSDLVLRLIPDGQDTQDLVLLEHQVEHSILDTAKLSSTFVFRDHRYHAQLLCPEYTIENLRFFVNGSPVNINYSQDTGMISFYDDDSRIFMECYGFVQLTVIFDDANGNHYARDTEFIQVMVRRGRQNDSVKRMTEYVYAKNSELLYGEPLPKEVAGLKDNAKKTLESRILLLEKIAMVYEENYRYFKTNCRYKTIPHERVDYFEKLQYVSSNTLQYIAQHPEELQPVYHTSGVKVGKNYYQPNKTLITDNKKTVDIYENQVIVGFLQHLNSEVARIAQELSAITTSVPRHFETGDYISSSYFIYASTISAIKLLLEDVQKLQKKYEHLFYCYATILPVKTAPVTSLPKFTHIFKSIQQYHQIYQCAISWFSLGAFSLSEERFMLSFIKISTLYEVYVLAKIISYFKSTGYELCSADKILYPVSQDSRFRNAHCNNVFLFKKGPSKVTVYYQPVVYSADMSATSGIGLFRNTSISFPEEDLRSFFRKKNQSFVSMYTPDYLLKYETENEDAVKYLIADAKFSTVDTVKGRQVAQLAYKYLFSISPISPKDQVVGLCVFNGQSDSENDVAHNIYDYELTSAIVPKAEIITLTENSQQNKERHDVLLHNAVGLYVSNPPRNLLPLPKHTGIPSEETEKVLRDRLLPKPDAPSIPKQPNQTNLEVPVAPQVSPQHTSGNENEATKPSLPNATEEPQKEEPRAKRSPLEEKLSQDISVLKLDPFTTKRLQEAGITTIGELVPNRNKADLSNNNLLNRKLRREIEARLKALKIVLKQGPLPTTDPSSSEPTIPPLPSGDMKVGEFVRQAMTNLSTSGYVFDDETIDEMCSSKWSIRTFHTQFAFMKKYLPESSDNKGPDGNIRFWSEPFSFGPVQVLISKEWHEGNQRQYFVEWYLSLRSKIALDATDQEG